ncbi:MAG: hypothetical protein OMM_03571 [Candidatus Magnetoglobus multicellularis str. Araruama]|uniref:Uncharacterized protein n=1 Tax=Candidatus Magnetoglobus multicellularis str. Araruama TaxID=890399 RepID=A0A1V1P599_9BACT|nr:MAG: hypothetical protein OMM_03571 [Candidatus Magnetoglobus multicellularis str. Araruama]
MYLATSSTDRSIRIWNINPDSFQLVSFLSEHLSAVNKCYWSPDATRIAALCSNGTIKVWTKITEQTSTKLIDCQTSSSDELTIYSPKFKNKKNIDPFHLSRVNACDISPDGRLGVSVSEDRDIKIWKMNKQKVIKTITLDNEVHSCSCSSDNLRMATVDFDHNIIIWEIKTGIKLKVIQEQDMPVHCKWSPDGSLLAYLACDTYGKSNIILWNDVSSKKSEKFPVNYGNTSWTDLPCNFDWLPDSKALIFADFKGCYHYDIEKLNLTTIISIDMKDITDLKVSPDGKYFGIIQNKKFNLYHIYGGFKYEISKDIACKRCQWIFSNDCICIIGNNDPMLHFYSPLSGTKVHSYYTSTFLSAISKCVSGHIFAAAHAGEVFLLDLIKIIDDYPFVWPLKLYSKSRMHKEGFLGKNMEVYCQYCGKKFVCDHNKDDTFVDCPKCSKTHFLGQ